MKIRIQAAMFDDDYGSMDIIANAITGAFEHKGIEINIHKYGSGEAILSDILNQSFDLVFCDIEMPGVDGIEVAKRIKEASPNSELVFVSNREDRVFDSLAVRPFGFVRKKNFIEDISLVVDAYAKNIGAPVSEKVVIKNGDSILAFSVNDVTYIESSKKNQFVHDSKGRLTKLSLTMEVLEESFAPYGFIMIYKGILVNYRFIQTIGVDGVSLLNGEKLPLARRKSGEVKQRYLALVKDTSPLVFKK